MSAAQGPPPIADPLVRDLVGRVAKYWWVELIIGAFWIDGHFRFAGTPDSRNLKRSGGWM
jgi:hypothetical protein